MKKNNFSLINKLKFRSKIISKIRKFFLKLNVLEVDTPILSKFKVTDVYLKSFKTKFRTINQKYPMWLITSPEYHMKRLIAENSGSIYQICHSFRNGEIGKYHNPEFSMLEWYQPGYHMHDLMKEVILFFKTILNCSLIKTNSYQDIYMQCLQIDPLDIKIDELIYKSKQFGIEENIIFSKKNNNHTVNVHDLLELIFSLKIEPKLGHKHPIIIYDYPSFFTSNAKINIKDFRISNRFEVFFKGIELANGCEELIDYEDQKDILKQNNITRKKLGFSVDPIDTLFLDGIKKTNFFYSGVAVGLDRLMMLIKSTNNIKNVLSFSIDNS